MGYIGFAVAAVVIILMAVLLRKPAVYGVLYVKPPGGVPCRYDVHQGTYIVGTFIDSEGNVNIPPEAGRYVGTSGLKPDGKVYTGKGFFRSSRFVNGPKSKPDFEGEIIFTTEAFEDETQRFPGLNKV